MIAFNKDEDVPIWYTENPQPKESYDHINSNEGFTPMYWGDALIYVCGRRGCGKSTWINTYLNAYAIITCHKNEKGKKEGNKIYFISRLDEDPSIKLPENSERINVRDIGDHVLEEFDNSLVIFDDIHSAASSPSQIKQLESLILDLMQNSRHHNCSMIISSHMIAKGWSTRDILNEISCLVVFPQFSNPHQIRYALKEYVGMNKDQIEKIMSEEKSRWVSIQTTQPRFLLTEFSCSIYRI